VIYQDPTSLIWFIIMGAIIDSIDPCIYVLYVSLLTVSATDIRHVMKISSSFILSVYIGYLVFNAILRFVLNIVSPSRSILSFVLILYALALILYTLLLERNNVEDICREDRPLCRFINRFDLRLRTLNIFSVAVIGFLASFTILPCSAGMVLAFNIVTRDLGFSAWIPLAALYTTVFVSPLLLISLAVIGLTKIKNVYELILRHQKLVKILGGILMILVAILIILGLPIL